MSDGLRLRRQDQPRGGSPAQAANAYGATMARAAPGAKIEAAAPAATPKRKTFAILAHWSLWGGAFLLLGGGVVLGTMLGGPVPSLQNQAPRTVSVVPQAIAKPQAALPESRTADLHLPAGWNPRGLSSETEERPALAPPPPPALPAPAIAAAEPVMLVPQPAPVQPTPVQAELPKPAEPAQVMPQQVAALPTAPAAAPVAKPAKPAALPVPPQSFVPPSSHTAPLPGTERWRQLAVPAPLDAKPPYIAIVIDDMGLDRRNSARAVNIPGPLTLSYMSYANELSEQSASARAKGHEVMLHLPMEPLDAKRNDPGPNALYVGMEEGELRRRVNWALDRFDDYAGVNNHMGSRFTADPRGMAIVLDELQRRGRFWLDSHTGPNSAGLPLAHKRGLAATGRDLFLDDERQSGGVAAQLAALERIARSNGDAIGIGHPHTATLEALERWVKDAKARGFSLVPVTTVLRNRNPERIASN
ncbi:divergent polysaccharide deacetylase family protein [Ferrovibrio sp.]|uniref:divergent polysaccharide deacetylase family protein n=1 Tax=Ferrovibrio sp. TaxID=1917215 RepID=UPI003D2B343C